ncbi:HEAT repeat domain-containing protein [Kibdelosporangium philippinense]|uniref:HEAT repeat domain-containing protein n=1 Tax=Kibdelosporangium philippinense TaxID=211113 RepID=A0ABS8ZK03_9PSEU|nr:HEAT repeat domain-containing protein [Kibdelosporangium philippinense]MCE7007877.1 HEAT repeat domain-containing protein [Kibdelosporangium philippinense]
MDNSELAAAIDRGELSLSELIEVSARTSPIWRGAQVSAVMELARTNSPQAHDALLDVVRRGDLLPTYAIRTIVPRGDKRFVHPLLEILSTSTNSLANAVFLLGETQSEAAVQPIADLIHDPALVYECVVALGKIGSPAALPALIDATRHDQYQVRLLAVRALRRIGDSRATKAAMAATDDVEPVVRAAAIRLLADIGGPETLGRLLAFAEGPECRAALAGIERLADPRSARTLQYVIYVAADRRTRYLAARALERSMHGAPVWNWQYLDYVYVRRVAVWFWRFEKHPDGLIRSLKDPDELVRMHAAAGLGHMATSEAVAPLRSALLDPAARVRAAAVTALRRIGEDVQSMRDDPHPSVRAAAGNRQR